MGDISHLINVSKVRQPISVSPWPSRCTMGRVSQPLYLLILSTHQQVIKSH